MKKFKISLVALFAIMIGITLSSFTVNHQQNKKTTMKWYTFVSNSPADADNYIPYVGDEPGCLSEPDEVCAVQATEGEQDRPDQTELDAIYSSSNHFTENADHLKYRASE